MTKLEAYLYVRATVWCTGRKILSPNAVQALACAVVDQAMDCRITNDTLLAVHRGALDSPLP